MFVDSFRVWAVGEGGGAHRENTAHPPTRLPMLQEHSVIAGPCLGRKEKITICSPREENKTAFCIQARETLLKGICKAQSQRKSQQSLLEFCPQPHLGLPVSGVRASLQRLGSLPQSPQQTLGSWRGPRRPQCHAGC